MKKQLYFRLRWKQSFLSCLAISFLIAFFMACSTSASTESRLQRVVSDLYTGPNDIQRNLLMNVEEDVIEGVNTADEYQAVLDTQFDPEDFTEDYFAGLSTVLLQNLVFPQICAMNDYTLEPKSVQIEVYDATAHAYSYQLEVKVIQGNEMQIIEEKGRIQTDENGLVSWINPDLTQLMEAIM